MGKAASRCPDVVLVGAITLLFLVVVGFELGGEESTIAFDNVVETAAALVAAVACFRTARRLRARPATAWWLLGASALSWGLGQVCWSYFESIAHTEPFPSVADVGYLGAIPLAVAGLLAFPSSIKAAGRVRAVIDGLIIACATLGLSWALVLPPVAENSGTGLELILALAYPVGDVVILVTAVTVITRVVAEWRPSLVTVSLGAGALALADSAFAYTASTGDEAEMMFNVGWVTGYLLIAMAARRVPVNPSPTSGAPGAPRWVTGLPFVPVIVFALAAAPNTLGNGHVHNAFVWTGIPLVLLLVLRQHLIHRDNLDLMRSLEQQIRALATSREDLRHQALHDPLTGLPNRAHLMRELDGRFSAPTPAETALLLLDLDRFKEINDGLGHDIGDQVLHEVARRLREATPPGDTVVRLGGDEFALVVDDPPGRGRARTVALDMVDAFRAPIEVGSMSLPVDASIGVARSAEAEDATTLLQRADVAMYRAKREGLSVAAYGDEDDEDRAGRLTLLADLRRTLDRGELEVHYQPQIDLTSGEVLGVEALARWRHPGHGWVAPDQFIPFSEQTGLIGEVTRQVLTESLEQCRRWQQQGLPLRVSVNLSPKALQDRDLVHGLREAILGARLPGRLLTLEITESAFATNTDMLIAVLDRLRTTGVRLSIDDFGTGYSSLSHLKRLPVHELKVDRSFVTDIAVDEHDQAIVRSVVALAHTLGLSVIAEGVEDQASLTVLTRLGCDAAQGFHLCRPAPAADITSWLAAHHGLPPADAVDAPSERAAQ